MPARPDFVLYIDIEHPLALLDRGQRTKHMRSMHRNCGIFREISGGGCLVQSFIWLEGSHLDELPLLAMIISGNRTDWDRYTPSQLREIVRGIRESGIPVLGICGGHQLICKAFGGRVAPMGRLKPGERDPNPAFRPGYLKEKGYTKVRVDSKHPLFLGLGDEILVHESHYCEVKEVPEGFRVLASTSSCRVQAVADPEERVFGVQFHPETHDPAHPDGRRILDNFFAIARKRA